MKFSISKHDPIHFIGIGGYGMSPLAIILKAKGYLVTGSEQTRSSSILDQLKEVNIPIYHGHSPSNVEHAQAVVYSSAINDLNCELSHARQQGKKIFHRSDILNFLLSEQKSITVSGTHGKTTTTALLAYALRGLGYSPSFAIGGVLENINLSGESGNGEFFVAESDESDGTFTKYSPNIAVVSNVDLDHLDYFKTKDALVDSFLAHLNKVKPDGVAIIGTDSPLLFDIAKHYHKKTLTFGMKGSVDYKILSSRITKDFNYFVVKTPKSEFEFALPTIGSHDFQNCTAVIATLDYLGISLESAAQVLKSYPGVKRRSTILYSMNDIKVLDDYAHNPGKISACLQSLKEKWPDFQVVTFYQPHRYSRLQSLYSEFLSSFKHSDKTIILPIYGAGEAPLPRMTHKNFARDLSNHDKLDVRSVDSMEEALSVGLQHLSKKTIFITVGAGDIYQLAYRLKEIILENQPSTKD